MRALFIVVLALAGCSQSAGERAEGAYTDAKNSGASQTQLCRSAQAVEQGYRADGDSEKADQWELYAQIDCSGAYFKEGYRY
jgi:hypothetical protein